MSLSTIAVSEFVAKTREKAPTPGGGSVAALVGQLGAALGGMALRYTAAKGDEAEVHAVVVAVDGALDELLGRLSALVDEDASAYESLRTALAMPKTTEDEVSARTAEVQRGLRRAAEVPLSTARLCLDGLEMLHGLRTTVTQALRSDLLCAGLLLRAACRAAACNVEVNLDTLRDEAFCGEVRDRLQRTLDRAAALEAELFS